MINDLLLRVLNKNLTTSCGNKQPLHFWQFSK